MELLDAVAVLGRTPDVLDALLVGLPQDWVGRDDGPGTWSAYDIVGHLIHGDDTDWLPRTRLIIDYGTERTFEAFDREGMRGNTPEPFGVLLDRLRTGRRARLQELAALDLVPSDLERRGLHPDLGEVTLGQLLATWAAHDLTHIAQIGEVLARRYRDDVGPWRAYLPALDRTADAE